jgi:hypothetical protein
MIRFVSCLGALLAIFLITMAGCGRPQGPVKHEVMGTVLVNDEPAAGIIVSLRHTSDSIKGKARTPVAVTDEDGVFVLSTDGEEDGAIEGEYVVTFVWPPANSPDGDRLGWKFSDTKLSRFRLKIPVPDGEAEPFRLQIDPNEIK